MKSEHRHELKTNELAEWIGNLPQWARKNLKEIIYVSVLVVAVAGAYFYHRYQKDVVSVREKAKLTNIISGLSQTKMRIIQAQTQGADISYMLLQIAQSLQVTAQDSKDDLTAALALIKQAEALRAELYYRLETATAEEKESQIGRALAVYNTALLRASASPSLTAIAKLGLGLCEEELGNYEQAQQIYRDIVEDPAFEGTTAVASAKLRLETMGDYTHEIVFMPPPEPETSLGPQIQAANPVITGPVVEPNVEPDK